MNRAAILRKVKACLRLAASSNSHEAAAALRQAQAMMAAHGISHAEAAGIEEAEVKTRNRGQMPPQSIVYLVNTVAEGFGAKAFLYCTWDRTVLRFYGADGTASIAAYAFTVLRRQLDADRLKHIARVRKRGNREARGEVFARAWVAAVGRLFPAAEVPDAQRLAIEQVIQAKYPSSGESAGRDLTRRGKIRDDDAAQGYMAGRNAKLHRGVDGRSPKLLEGTKS